MPAQDGLKRSFVDPFANVGVLKPVGAGGVSNVAASNKPVSYEEKLQNEVASRGSFLDMIGSSGAGAPAQKQPA